MDDQEEYIEALIKLHSGLKRQGPGDVEFSDDICNQLPELPRDPRIADIGCGAGAGALFLAKKYHSKVKAVDFSKEFLDQMMHRAAKEGVEGLIDPIECDMANLDWEPASIDLLWSEGAAYNITFEGALKAWRPLMSENGIAIVSEMNYFSEPPPEIVSQYMKHAYPGIKTEAKNVAWINSSGFELIEMHRLPSAAWWDNYYGPLRENMVKFEDPGDEMMQMVIDDTEEEMKFFESYHEEYGYTFYIMRTV